MVTAQFAAAGMEMVELVAEMCAAAAGETTIATEAVATTAIATTAIATTTIAPTFVTPGVAAAAVLSTEFGRWLPWTHWCREFAFPSLLG